MGFWIYKVFEVREVIMWRLTFFVHYDDWPNGGYTTCRYFVNKKDAENYADYLQNIILGRKIDIISIEFGCRKGAFDE